MFLKFEKNAKHGLVIFIIEQPRNYGFSKWFVARNEKWDRILRVSNSLVNTQVRYTRLKGFFF